MRCQDSRRYLNPYMDSELDAKTCTDITNHLAVCEACSKRFAQEQEIEKRLVKRLQREKMPDESWEVILERLNAYDSPGRRRVRLAWLVPAAVVPVVTAVLMLFFLWGKAPDNTNSWSATLQEMHGKYLKQEISISPGLSWPQEFQGLTVLEHLPQSGVIGGHDVQLLGGRPFYAKDIHGAHIVYTCCNTPASMFILRKEDMRDLKRAQRLLDKGKGFAVVDLGNMRLSTTSEASFAHAT
ncbi:MAG TPA: anti-sigma factor family protein, partial [Candidatus Tripitaka californicus]|uniref:anti-sigma factor family protein n=1 Tax=Candidatus Tripitaka californicus TaxID=3367616 RepID=UPI004025BD4D